MTNNDGFAKVYQRLIRFVDDCPGHDMRYAIDATRIQMELGWNPKHHFEEALETTVDWYLNKTDWVNSVRRGEYRKWIKINYTSRKSLVGNQEF